MKKVLKILTLIMLILTILKIGDTYAKYYAKAQTATLSQDVGQWVIKVNEMDIYSETGESVEFTINKFNNFSNPDAAPDKISPSSTGYTDIVIDPTGTDVAVRYDIEIELTGVSSLAIEARLEMASGVNTLVKTGENTYSGIISLADVQAGTTADVRCYINWNNDENKNEEDTLVGTGEQEINISLSANVTVTQYLGEVLTPYVATEATEATEPTHTETT